MLERPLVDGSDPERMSRLPAYARLNDPADRFCGSYRLFASDGAPIEQRECGMALALRTDREYNVAELIVERPGGGRRTVRAHAAPIHDASGTLVDAASERDRDRGLSALRARVGQARTDSGQRLRSSSDARRNSTRDSTTGEGMR
jgi:hypothetical protein